MSSSSATAELVTLSKSYEEQVLCMQIVSFYGDLEAFRV